MDAGELRVEVDSVFPLTKARAAFERVASRGKRGKVVLEVGTDLPAGAAVTSAVDASNSSVYRDVARGIALSIERRSASREARMNQRAQELHLGGSGRHSPARESD